jgi:long-chain acyl-CoA synthetase
MQGYWNEPEETAQVLDPDGWLHTGDLAEIRDGDVGIRGRLKEILVTSTGEKVSPVDMEMAMTMEPVFDQAMIVGEGRPYLSVLAVLAQEPWQRLAEGLTLDPSDPGALTNPGVVAVALSRIGERLSQFPGYARVRKVHLSLVPWTVADGLITPTMKVKRPELQAHFARAIDALYR